MNLGTIVGILIAISIIGTGIITYFVLDYYVIEEKNIVIDNYKNNMEVLNKSLDSYVYQINSLSENSTQLISERNSFLEQINNLNNELNMLKLPNKYHLRDPTEREVLDFIDMDKTDRNEYDYYDYSCVNFASDVDSNAAKLGIRCGVLYFDYWSYDWETEIWDIYGHAINVFDTSDNGRLYVDIDDEVYYSFAEIEDDYEEIINWGISW